MKTSWMMGIALAGLMALALLAGCAQDRGEAVLVVDGDTTTVDEFRQLAIMRFRGEQMARETSREEMEEYLDVVLEGQLKVVDGRSRGFANRPDVVQAFEDARNMAAIGKLYQEQIVGSILPEDSLRMYYERNGKQVNASHLLIRIDADTDSVQAYNEVVKIEKELRADGSVDSTEFSEAAKKYSEDTSAQDGELGFFGLGAMVPTFEAAAWTTEPGSMSGPVYTPFGWHLLFVHDTREREDRGSYDEELERTKQIAMQANAQKLMDSARDYIKGLEAERNVEFNLDKMEEIYEIVNPRLPNRDPFSLLTEEQQDWALITYDDGETVTAGDLRAYVRQYVQQKLRDPDQVRALAENWLTEKVILPKVAEEKGYLSDREVMDQARMASDSKIRQLVNEDLNQLPEPSEDDLKGYFQKHINDYMLEAQMNLVEILVSDRALADSLKALAEGGANMKELAGEYSERATGASNDGMLGPIKRSQYGAIGRNAAEAEVGSVVGPIRFQNKWSVFKVISKEEPKPEKFEDVRAKVNVDWRSWARENRQTEYMDSLRATIDYKVYYEALDGLFGDGGNSDGDSSAS